MTEVATVWLGFALLLALFAWFNRAWLLLPAIAAALVLSFAPLSRPAFWQPAQGKYVVVGARIVPDRGIWILIADGADEPRYFKLPYSKREAEQLQMLMDLTGGEPGAIAMTIGEGGEPDFEDGRPAETETKQAERPIYGGGNG